MGMRGLHVDLELGLVAVLARTHAQVACYEHAVSRSLELLFGVELLLYLTILFVELVQALRHVGIVGISRRHGKDAIAPLGNVMLLVELRRAGPDSGPARSHA